MKNKNRYNKSFGLKPKEDKAKWSQAHLIYVQKSIACILISRTKTKEILL